MRFKGVHPATGIYQFEDLDNNGVLDNRDYSVLVHTDPKWFGGFSNSFLYRNWGLDVFVEFKKQTGYNYLATQSTFIPGYYYFNQPSIVMERWQKPGDQAAIQLFAATGNSAAYLPASLYLINSDAVYSDASYIRLKNVSLSYKLPPIMKKRWRMENGQLFMQAQNLFTFTKYKGADPENQDLYRLPPLKTWVLGFQCSL